MRETPVNKGAIIGLGSIGKSHLEASEDNVDIIAICDSDPNRLSEIRGYSTYTDYVQLLAEEELDFVDICLPHSLHLPVITAALDRGLDVLCEKPLVQNEEELGQLERTLEGRNNRVITNHNYWYTPQFETMKSFISEGHAGKPLYVMLRVDMRDSFWEAPWRSVKGTSREGIFLDDGIHLCYLTRWLTGSEPVSVNADIRNVTFEEGHPDDFGRAIFEFDSGCVADICCTAFKENKKSFSARRVECEDATLILPHYSLSPHLEVHWKDGKVEEIPVEPKLERGLNDHFKTEFVYAYSQLLTDFNAGQFRHDVEFPKVRNDLRMVFNAYESSESGRKIFF